ncbi:MAG: FHA domain-containing protein [Myxococcales bacterium]|nr:FHA domain-containing protein [Myxococcales bacterium]
MAKIIVISGDERQEYELAAFNSIGRHPDNTIQILDRIISKEHAHIQRGQDGKYLLRDLRSLNGTFIRGERVGDHYLQDGDEVMMGSTRIVFVDKPLGNDALGRVTIAPGLTESHIRQRIQANTGFMQERQIGDDKILRRDYERLRIGHELALAVGTELDLDKLLPKILEKAFELVGADRGVILLTDERNELAPRFVKTRTGKGDPNIVLSRTVMAEVVNSKTAVLSSDATMDARFSGAHSIIMQGIRSTMTVPLLHRDELLGVMHLDSLFTSNAFTEKDLQICTGMAVQAQSRSRTPGWHPASSAKRRRVRRFPASSRHRSSSKSSRVNSPSRRAGGSTRLRCCSQTSAALRRCRTDGHRRRSSTP